MLLPTVRTLSLLLTLSAATLVMAAEKGPLWLHPDTTPLPTDKLGPFVRAADNVLITVDKEGVHRSSDEGTTWQSAPLEVDIPFEVSNERALIYTSDGVLILACMNLMEKHPPRCRPRHHPAHLRSAEPGPGEDLGEPHQTP